ncbi:MAG: beta-galactosidase [Lentilactobacillus diolivorans]|uniref:beta-galactosidase n=2 Tax=Lentilactobacillus diolivorans TaxID=179838 RepID=A0A0R1SFV3_9LACO|nr:beta-galactosidase [Lentilactobacillus diolivorans]KRL65514.1 beta-galactosidase [Lentilactobacillus diolivorans DSM 14421]GEP24172.1 beta-galactosidase LacZ [Lentilactobacillus diolivorans]
MDFKNFLYGAAYYYEYLPYDRLDEDIKMMKDANINVVRIGESTWSTYEPQEGVFDFSKLDKVVNAMQKAGINVIIGTPTYAIPTWMAKAYPEVLLTDKTGKHQYGSRQIIDITNPTFRSFSERIIRKMIERTVHNPAVIGFQVDNETKHFDTSSENVYLAFEKWLKKKFNGDLDKLNHAYGLDYWSNRINAWEDFPPINSTINGSLGTAFEAFKRTLVTDFLTWQVNIVNEYKRSDQFVTNNFDFEWRKQSFGLNADSNHFEVSKPFDVTAVDVYHPTQDHLTGTEIAFCGDVARSTKDKNYIVMETEAQAFRHWVPYPGQLTLQAFSHIASGANMISYWHWHSVHNSYETYWKGLLGHDFRPNPVYNEAKTIGKKLNEIGSNFLNTKKKNRVAFVVSNQALSAVDWFPYKNTIFDKTGEHQYNDVLRSYYDPLYRLNVEADILQIGDPRITNKNYDFLIVPMLYSATDEQLEQLNQFIKNGGNVLYSFRSGYTNQDVKARTDVQPALISKSVGAEYELFVEPNRNYGTDQPEKDVTISGSKELSGIDQQPVKYWMELLTPTTGKALATYDHPYWGKYAAITENQYGNGNAFYAGSYLNQQSITELYQYILKKIGLWTTRQEQEFPIINKQLVTSDNSVLDFYFNYSNQEQTVKYCSKTGQSILNDLSEKEGDSFTLKPWGLQVFRAEN